MNSERTLGAGTETVRKVDPAVAAAIEGEVERQRSTLQMIASENHASEAVLAAQGSVFTNKYAEGRPGTRYYGGCEFADEIEQLAIEHAKELWGAEHVNVQPHSGTSANLAAYAALLDPGDRILSLSLDDGGHLSHGYRSTVAGQHFEVAHYGVDFDTGRIDYDAVRQTAEAFAPDLIVSGASAYPRTIDFERFQAIAEEVGAFHLADIAHVTGLVVAGLHPSPVGVADVVTGSTHKTIRAGRGGIVMTDEEHAKAVDRAVFPGTQGGPLMHNVAGKAVGFEEALDPTFEHYAERVVANARALAEQFEEHGLDLVSGGTDVHFVLVDLRASHPISGREAEAALERAAIVLNANPVPGSDTSSRDHRGIRVGTPALTTRGFDADDLRTVADLIVRVLDAPDDDDVRASVRREVAALCEANPLYA